MTRPVVWIVGAGSGTGRACAEAAASQGWDVALSGRRATALDETRASLAGVDSLVQPLDIATDDCAPVADVIRQRWGRLDAVVVTAGVNTPRRGWGDQDLAETGSIIATNLLGPVRVIDAAMPLLEASRGSAVVVSSRSGWSFAPESGIAYGASKTALSSIVRSVNAHGADRGVRACLVCPGEIDTDLLRQRPEMPGPEARALMLQPADVARVVMFVLESPPHVRIDEIVLNPSSQP